MYLSFYLKVFCSILNTGRTCRMSARDFVTDPLLKQLSQTNVLQNGLLNLKYI